MFDASEGHGGTLLKLFRIMLFTCMACVGCCLVSFLLLRLSLLTLFRFESLSWCVIGFVVAGLVTLLWMSLTLDSVLRFL